MRLLRSYLTDLPIPLPRKEDGLCPSEEIQSFLFISARLRGLENQMLTQARMERMLEAKTNEDAAKVLSECGYEDLESP